MAKKETEEVVEGMPTSRVRIILPLEFADVATLKDKLNEIIARLNN